MGKIYYQRGSIFDAETQVIVNTVNCKGVMGKGLALAFKERYPDMFPVYQRECREGRLHIGRPTLYQKSVPWILNFPTKDSWKANSKIEYLEKGLVYFATNYKQAGITSIAFPKLGTQNGKLDWSEVGPLMTRYLAPLALEVHIYISDGDFEYQDNIQSEGLQHKLIWTCFNDLAQSQEKLRQELLLNLKDSKKIAQARMDQDFASLKDIEGIDGLAKTSLQKVKNFIHNQTYISSELAGMSATKVETIYNSSPPYQAKKASKRRKSQKLAEGVQASTLFPTEVVN